MGRTSLQSVKTRSNLSIKTLSKNDFGRNPANRRGRPRRNRRSYPRRQEESQKSQESQKIQERQEAHPPCSCCRSPQAQRCRHLQSSLCFSQETWLQSRWPQESPQVPRQS